MRVNVVGWGKRGCRRLRCDCSRLMISVDGTGNGDKGDHDCIC